VDGRAIAFKKDGFAAGTWPHTGLGQLAGRAPRLEDFLLTRPFDLYIRTNEEGPGQRVGRGFFGSYRQRGAEASSRLTVPWHRSEFAVEIRARGARVGTHPSFN